MTEFRAMLGGETYVFDGLAALMAVAQMALTDLPLKHFRKPINSLADLQAFASTPSRPPSAS